MSNEKKLKEHIELVAMEIYSTTGARVFAAASCISAGVDNPEDLYDEVLQLIGSDATMEGCDEDGEPYLGYCGIPFNAFEAYLALHGHFGENWLEQSLRAYLPDDPVNAVNLMRTAKDSTVKAAYGEAVRKIARVAGEVAMSFKQFKDFVGA